MALADVIAGAAERRAQEDAEGLATSVRYARMAAMTVKPGERLLIVDGSQYSPSWRALKGGAETWEYANAGTPDVTEDLALAAQETYELHLDLACDELGLVWEDGCLFYYVPEEA